MKLGIIETFLSDGRGGAEISSNLLKENLIKNNVNFFTIVAKSDLKLMDNTYVLPFTNKLADSILVFGSWFIDVYIKLKIKSILKREKPSLIHVQDFSVLPAVVSAVKSLNIPVVLTTRDYRFNCNLSICLQSGNIEHNCPAKNYLGCLKKTFKQRYNNKFLAYLFFPWLYSRNKVLINASKKVDYFITVSDFVKNEIIKIGISRNKISTIKVLSPEWKLKRLKKQSKTIIFSAGILVESKGFHNLIDAMRFVIKKNKNIELVIAGTGPLENKLKQKIIDCELQNHVKLLGRISFSKMKQNYQNSSFVVMPSIWPEPLSRTIFEAFSLKKPVISTVSGGSPELVKNNKTGILVPINNPRKLAEAILKLAKNKKLAEKLGNRAYLEIQKSDKKFFKEHLKVYFSLDKNNY